MTQAQSVNPSQHSAAVDPRSRLGDTLKNARLKAGVTIDAVAHETKISKQFIVYLESGHFEQLPGQVFGRGFIKNIARFLRSDTDSLLRMYDDCWGEAKSQTGSTGRADTGLEQQALPTDRLGGDSAQRDEAAPAHKFKTTDIPDIKQLPSLNAKRNGIKVPAWFMRGLLSQHAWLTILATIAAVMVVGVFGRWVTSRVDRAPLVQSVSPVAVSENKAVVENGVDISTQSGSDDAVDLSVPTGVVSVDESAMPANVVDKVIDTKATSIDTAAPQNQLAPNGEVVTAAAVPAAPAALKPTTAITEDSPLSIEGSPVAFEQILDINVTAPVEMRLIVDGKKTDRMSYGVGATQLTFRDRAELYIYDASAVEITFNGKSLGSLGSKGRKRKIFFQAKPSESEFPH